MAVIKVSDDLRKRLQGENSAAPAAPAATGTIKVSDELRLRLMGETATAKEGLGTASPSANAGTIKVSDQLKARLMGAATQQPAIDTAAQEKVAKIGIIEDPEDKLVEQLSKRYTTEGRMETLGEMEDSKRFSTVYEDTFAGQTKANNAAAALAEKESLAWSAYLDSGSEADLAYAQGLASLREQFTAENAAALDDENVKAGWISKTMASYLPQLANQVKYGVAGAVTGAAIGSAVPIAGTAAGAKAGYMAGQGMHGYQVMRGAAYKSLIEAGVDPETARKAAQDEGVVNGLIEAAEAGFTLASKGAKLLTMAGGKAAGKEIAADTLKTALKKYGINIGTEALQEAAQETVSYANENREDKGGGALGLVGEALGAGGQVLSGQNKEAAQRIGAAAGEGAKIAAMFGAVSSAGSYLGQQRLAQQTEEATADVGQSRQATTYIDTDPAAHTQEENQRISEFVNSTDSGLLGWVQRVRNALRSGDKTAAKMKQRLQPVNEKTAIEVMLKTGVNVAGYSHSIDGIAISHIENRHGPNGKADHSMQFDEDIARIPYVLDNFDECELLYKENGIPDVSSGYPNADNTPSPKVRFSKKIDGTYYVVEAVPDSARKELRIVTAYIERKKQGDHPSAGHVVRNNEPPQPTPEAPLGPVPLASNASVADGGASVNPQTAPSQYATNTMQQAAAAGTLPQDMADANAGAQHRVIGWEETTADAQAEIEQRGVTGSANDLILKAGRGEAFTSRDVQKAQILLQQLSKSAVQSERDQAIELGTAIINASSDIGRALNIMRSMIRELPGGLLRVTERQVAAGGGVLSEQDKADINALEQIINSMPELQQLEGNALTARLGVLTADMSGEYRRAVGRVFDAKNGDPANADKWMMLLSQKKVAERTGSSAMDKFTAMQRVNLLLNPKTQMRNLAGNLLSFGMENVSDLFAGAVDKVLAKKTGQRTVGSGKISEAARGAKESAAEVQLARELGVVNQLGNRYAEDGKARPLQAWSGNDKAAQLGNWLNDFTTYLLTLGDATFSGGREAQVQAQLEELNGGEADWISDVAETAGREVTYQNDSKIAQKVLAMRNWMGNGILARIIMPFAKTPANILSRSISYSPLGFVEGAYAAYKVLNDANVGPEMQRKAATAIGRAMYGTLLTAAGAGLAAAGRASGAAPEDKDEAAFMKDVGGVLPNAFKIGNTWVDLSNLGPGMVALNLGATVFHELQNAGTPAEVAAQATEALLNGVVMDVTGDSLWQGLLDAAAYFEEGNVGGFVQSAIADGLSQMVPLQSFLRAITGSVDKYKRETSAEGGDIGWSVNYIKSNIPGVSQKMPIKYDVTGEAVERYEGGWGSDVLNSFLNPASAMSKDKTDSELYQQVMKVYEKEGSKSVFPTVAPYSVEYKGEKYALRGKERSEYQQASGKDITARLDELFGSEAYKQATSSQQVDMMADLISYSTADAKTGFLAGKDVAYEKSGISATIDKLAAYDVPASAVVLISATERGNDNGAKNSGAVKVAKAAAKLGLSEKAEQALIEHFGSKTIAECVKTARAQKVDVADYLDTYQGFANAEDPAEIVQAVRGAAVKGDVMLTMLTDSAEGKYSRFDGRWTVNGRSYAKLTPETYTALVLCLDGSLNKAENIKRLTAAGFSETAASDFYTVFKSNSSKYD